MKNPPVPGAVSPERNIGEVVADALEAKLIAATASVARAQARLFNLNPIRDPLEKSKRALGVILRRVAH